jgi:hypothetical protein
VSPTHIDWWLLMFQLPARPTAARVRVWRQLRRIGAVAVRGSGYVLPRTDAAREDFEWLRADIVAAGGEATVFEARATDAAADQAIRQHAIDARREDYAALARDAARLAAPPGRARGRRPSPARLDRDRRAIAERLARLDEIDHFGAGRDNADRAAVQTLLDRSRETAMPVAAADVLPLATYYRRVWVTRPRPGIDRFASAWLIRHFIDPAARFAFAPSLDAAGAKMPRAVPFDMYGAEFGHEAGGCTFETLVRRFGLDAPGLNWLGRLVHVLDLKADAADVPEALAVGRIVDGLRQQHADDEVLLGRGMEMIDALYRSRPVAATPARGRRRAAGSRVRRDRR